MYPMWIVADVAESSRPAWPPATAPATSGSVDHRGLGCTSMTIVSAAVREAATGSMPSCSSHIGSIDPLFAHVIRLDLRRGNLLKARLGCIETHARIAVAGEEGVVNGFADIDRKVETSTTLSRPDQQCVLTRFNESMLSHAAQHMLAASLVGVHRLAVDPYLEVFV